MRRRCAPDRRGRADAGRYLETVRTAASFLRRDDGPAVAVFDTTGWDTHFNEGGAHGQLRTRLAVLDQSLRTLKDSLADVWPRTVVLLATEFGRTAAANGTRGTDHGTRQRRIAARRCGARAGACWRIGPACRRARCISSRDLKPTLDLRSVIKSVLHDHLQISPLRSSARCSRTAAPRPTSPGCCAAATRDLKARLRPMTRIEVVDASRLGRQSVIHCTDASVPNLVSCAS